MWRIISRRHFRLSFKSSAGVVVVYSVLHVTQFHLLMRTAERGAVIPEVMASVNIVKTVKNMCLISESDN